jgi:hypothetical protein
MIGCLLAYDAGGAVIASLEWLMVPDGKGGFAGPVDFEAHEAGGGRLRECWDVADASGSCFWPEFLGSRATEYRIELAGGRASALVHRVSGERRDRTDLERRIREAPVRSDGSRDLRSVVGGPDRPVRPADPVSSLPLLGMR